MKQVCILNNCSLTFLYSQVDEFSTAVPDSVGTTAFSHLVVTSTILSPSGKMLSMADLLPSSCHFLCTKTSKYVDVNLVFNLVEEPGNDYTH